MTEGFNPERYPLRSEPVWRDEVRIYPVWRNGERRWRMTMPIGTFSLVEREKYSPDLKQTFTHRYFVADADLWQPLLTAEKRFPLPELWGFDAREYACRECGTRFLDHSFRSNQVRLCSNRCERDRHNAQQRRWRIWAGRETDNAARTQRRAEARAGRTCAHCGTPIEAARSTKQFCSDICRVHWHREKAAQ